jgi:hypothetical protein
MKPTEQDSLFTRELIEAASFTPKWLKEPYSWVGHIPFATWLVCVAKPRVIVELGTHSGNSYFAICQAVKQYETGSKCYAVDTWQGDAHALSYGEEIYDMVRKNNDENYASFSKLLRMTFDEALFHFEDHSVDLLHIDGLHTYEAVKHDFETWLPKLAPGAIVLFHDTNVRRDDFGVWKYWAELKAQYSDGIEFLHSHGLGVLQIPDEPEQNETKFSLKALTTREVDFFSSIGKRFDYLSEIAAANHANQKHLTQVRELWNERDVLAVKCRALTSEVEMLKSSLSWKLTVPLRLLDFR